MWARNMIQSTGTMTKKRSGGYSTKQLGADDLDTFPRTWLNRAADR